MTPHFQRSAMEPGPASFRAAALRNRPAHLNGWVSVASPPVVEAMARAGSHSVTFDAQHGGFDYAAIVEGVAAAALASRPAMVRLPIDGYGLGARALDAGAAGLIAPMIDTAADARAFVDAVKFPPVGRRSWGPGRALSLSGMDRDSYLTNANTSTLALAMIETARALENVEEIVAVEGVDGLLIGPNDLSVSLTQGAAIDVDHPLVTAALDRVLAAAGKVGKPVAIYANTSANAADFIRRGFPFISLGSDMRFLTAGAEQALADALEAGAGG